MLSRKNIYRLLISISILGVYVVVSSTLLLLAIQDTNARCRCGNDTIGENPQVLGVPKIDEFTAVGSDQDHINVSLSINVTAKSGMASVVLYYQVSGAGSWKSSSMTLVNKVYVTTVGYFKAKDIVLYYVHAIDNIGQSTCSPANASSGYYTMQIPSHPVIHVVD